MRVLVTVAVVLGFGALDHRSWAAEPASDDRIERARGSVLDDRYQSDLPRYSYEDAVACARDPNCRVSLGVGGGEAGQGGQRGSGGQGRQLGSGAQGSGAGAGNGSDGAVNPHPHRRGGGEMGNDPRDRSGRTIDTREQPAESSGVSGVMAILMWGILIVIAVLLVFWIVTEFFKRGDEQLVSPASESQIAMKAAVDAIIDRPLGDADELAQRGLYAEAIHTLLLRTLQELVRSAAVRVGPAMTSREILARVPLLADAREALAGLITAVEITHFGDEPANAADYDRCRQQFHLFATAFRASNQRAQAPSTSPARAA